MLLWSVNQLLLSSSGVPRGVGFMPNGPLRSLVISCHGSVGYDVTESSGCGRQGLGWAAAHGIHDEQYSFMSFAVSSQKYSRWTNLVVL